MDGQLRIVGVHAVDAPVPCCLVELAVARSLEPLDFGAISQELSGQPRANWQVPWDERLLAQTADESRWAFFFHNLDCTRPMLTPAGQVDVPVPTPVPDHLQGISYEPP